MSGVSSASPCIFARHGIRILSRQIMSYVALRRYVIILVVIFSVAYVIYNIEFLVNYTKTFTSKYSSDSDQFTMPNVDWKSVTRRRNIFPKEDLHDRWIVLTTINQPTEDVKKLAGIKGWKVVVVGDTKTPANWSFPNCVFLDVEKQKSLGYKIVDFIPYKTYTRKNIGYLYAIEHGAKFIYETDDDNYPFNGEIKFTEQETADFVAYKTDSPIVNPYAYFGQSSIWPRGYPLDHIADPPVHKFGQCKAAKPSIQQGVVDGDPDVDAIFRLTRKDRGVQLAVEFDKRAPPVALPANTMSPFNSQNTFFQSNAFWCLLLPISVAFRVTDIWRGYWAQRLLWESGGNLIFYPPNAYQVRSAHNYLDDLIDEKQLYHEAGKLVEFLVKWDSQKPHLFSRVLDLSEAMVNAKFWGKDDALLTEAWLKDLISIGYIPPPVAKNTAPCTDTSSEVLILPKEQPSSYLTSGKVLKLINKQ